ncbi:hypothetical protein BpHYR1_043888 [Brachionus plicatilis]|uniref:Uncharacterized protein n=1 Tax=Brachionus plicatilis TaxID=10195 RepID=A0A3M7T7U8_BRAPC|nr:hypothetical protein BpHYR1_043888 [Brachionus plicatilis]
MFSSLTILSPESKSDVEYTFNLHNDQKIRKLERNSKMVKKTIEKDFKLNDAISKNMKKKEQIVSQSQLLIWSKISKKENLIPLPVIPEQKRKEIEHKCKIHFQCLF